MSDEDLPEPPPFQVERVAISTVGIGISVHKAISQAAQALSVVAVSLDTEAQKTAVNEAVSVMNKANSELATKLNELLKIIAPEDLDDGE